MCYAIDELLKILDKEQEEINKSEENVKRINDEAGAFVLDMVFPFIPSLEGALDYHAGVIYEGLKNYELSKQHALHSAVYLFNLYCDLMSPEDQMLFSRSLNDERCLFALNDLQVRLPELQEKRKEQDALKRKPIRNTQTNQRKQQESLGMGFVFVLFFGPAIWAMIGAIGHFDSWYYSLFKIMVIIESCILLSMRLNEPSFRNEKMAISTIFVAVLSLICLVSFFSGLPKSVWVVLDIAYAAMQYVLFLGHSEWSRRMIMERTGRDPMEGFR